MATKLILIRHGQTDWNLEKRYCGFMDIDLNGQGKAQAFCVHKRLKGVKVDKVYTSDRLRAIHTADIIFEGRRYEKIPDLREIHFGIFEGLTYDAIMEKYSGLYTRWMSDPYSVTIPEGENLDDFKRRVVSAFQKIVSSQEGRTIAVVCHGGVISIFITEILKTRDFWKQIPGSASMSIVEYAGAAPVISLLNDTAHLV